MPFPPFPESSLPARCNDALNPPPSFAKTEGRSVEFATFFPISLSMARRPPLSLSPWSREAGKRASKPHPMPMHWNQTAKPFIFMTPICRRGFTPMGVHTQMTYGYGVHHVAKRELGYGICIAGSWDMHCHDLTVWTFLI